MNNTESLYDFRASRLKLWINDHYEGKQQAFIDANNLRQGEVSALLNRTRPFGERKARSLEMDAKMPKGFLDGLDSNKNDGTDGSISPINTATHVNDLPLLSWVQAGNWTSSPSIIKNEITRWLPALPNASKNSFYLEVKGISNAPYFEEGELICIDPDWYIQDIQTGEMIVARCQNEETFKALINEPHRRYLKALNPNFQPNIIELNDDCIFVGKYIGSYKPSKKYL